MNSRRLQETYAQEPVSYLLLNTDVITLKMRGLEVSCANLSCGYYLPHTPHEFTCVEDLMNCYGFVRHIVQNCRKTYRHQIHREELYGYGLGVDGFFEYDDMQSFRKNRMNHPTLKKHIQ
jgi:hypothetical protein